MITIYEWKNDRFEASNTPIEDIIYNESEDSFYWIDFDQHDRAQEKSMLQQLFKLNPLATSDAQRDRHPPKFEQFENFSFLLLKVYNDNPDTPEFETNQLAIFYSQQWIITLHHQPVTLINDTMLQLNNAESFQEALTPMTTALMVARQCSHVYTEELLQVEDRLEILEEDMNHHPDDSLLKELVSHKTRLRRARRIHAYHKTVAKELIKAYNIGSSLETQHRLNDLYDHFERLYSLSSMYYDTASDLIEGYISVASHHLNHIMKVLTIITAIFVPLSFLAGLYGMNFVNIPELKSPYGYFILLGVMGFIAITLIIVFRVRKWV